MNPYRYREFLTAQELIDCDMETVCKLEVAVYEELANKCR